MPAPGLNPIDLRLQDLLHPTHGASAIQPIDAGVHDIAGNPAPHRAPRAAEPGLPSAARGDVRNLEPKQATRFWRRATPPPAL
jgi:hypothetical protein